MFQVLLLVVSLLVFALFPFIQCHFREDRLRCVQWRGLVLSGEIDVIKGGGKSEVNGKVQKWGRC